ncbi:hypothetical protein BD413DRAFT_720873 [Trametes elegans]|nr:hypothetical protein BD413DRAFT_720873 [Trametes elegans]
MIFGTTFRSQRFLILLLVLVLFFAPLSLLCAFSDSFGVVLSRLGPFDHAGPSGEVVDGASTAPQSEAGKLLGIFSQVLVVSRPSRHDRRATMERLRLALGLQWTYVDAISHDEAIIDNISRCIRSIRVGSATSDFLWPATAELEPSMDEFSASMPCYTSIPFSLDSPRAHPGLGTTTQKRAVTSSLSVGPLTCATENHVRGVEMKPSLPSHMMLTPAKIACWYSHLGAIRRVAARLLHSPSNQSRTAQNNARDAFLILEDDVDMEQNISSELQNIWAALPGDWDIVFLGHCWSNESYYPALGYSTSPKTTLHPSFAPKCTHAYAVNPAGAHRLLHHLTYPPFAYSRALDQALAWLVQSGRLSAFSVVPSLVVQHKGSGSDIDQGVDGKGSIWRDRLMHGVLGI